MNKNTIELRSKNKAQTSLIEIAQAVAGVGLFCGVFAYGLAQWIFG